MVTGEAEDTQQGLEQLWKIRLQHLERRLETATDEVKRTGDPQRGATGKTPTGESVSHARAIGAYIKVLTEYVRVSKIYQDLVLRGKPPG